MTDCAGTGHTSIMPRCALGSFITLIAIAAAGCSRTEILSSGPNDAALVVTTDAGAVPEASADAHPGDATSSTPDGPAPGVDAGAPSLCNSTTCPKGCCQTDGTCVMSFDNTSACGYGGEACAVCAPGDVCSAACWHNQTNCGPSNCAGCCFGVSMCATGENDLYCGRHGEDCERCVPSEGTGQCVLFPGGGGACNGAPSCGGTGLVGAGCPGCCADGACMVGLEDNQCGVDGVPCLACPAGQQCVAAMGNGGQCAVVDTCGPASCPGCCDGDTCVYGNQDAACGTGGAACVDCSSSHRSCITGACE